MEFCLLLFIFNDILYVMIILEFMPYDIFFARSGAIANNNNNNKL